ncbi:hypothetical protein ACQKNX_24470 [Lysinibacillus sp. NPDC093712]|uniref:hypothetical protein n=1 Tax=Lysinibacillus sp. NPDC093712 TaxID=3390579 RepID=UPI003D055392
MSEEQREKANYIAYLFLDGKLVDFAYQIAHLYNGRDYREISAVMGGVKAVIGE